METKTTTLLQRMSKEHQDKIFKEALRYPSTWDDYLKELQGGYYTSLSLID